MTADAPLEMLYGWAREYGDIFRWRALYFRIVFLNHPDCIERVLVTDSRKYIKGRALQGNRELFGNGLLTSEGDFWMQQRRLIQPAFNRERILTYAATMVEHADQMVASWRAGEDRDLHVDFMRVTLENAAATLFGASVSDIADKVGQALDVLVQQNATIQRLLPLVRKLPTPGNRRYSRAVRQLDDIVYGIIAKRRASAQSSDLLSLLLQAQDENGSHMSDRQLRDECITLLLAGHETTALALTWTTYLVAQHPAVEEKLRHEVDTVLAGRLPGAADLPNLVYTARVLKESLRLYPPAWAIVRMANEECEIRGFRIPAKSGVIISPWVMHRDPRYFDDPERFNPDRWTERFQQGLPRFAYFPFGGGPRMCIGAGFATLEATLIIAILAQRFHFQLVAGHPVTAMPSITLRLKYGLRATVFPR